MNSTPRHIFVVTDIEGVAGVTDWIQTRTPGAPLEEARRHLTGEINSVVVGLFDRADELGLCPHFRVTVWDGHGPGGTAFDELDSRVTKFRHTDSRGLGGLFDLALAADPPMDAVAFVGQHAMAGTGGNLCHTYSSQRVRKHLLNGVEIGEFGTRSLHAWCLGVPTVFFSGDDVACREAAALVEGLVKVQVKTSKGILKADSVTHEQSCDLLKRAAMSVLDLDLHSPFLKPMFLPDPPYLYEKFHYPRWGVVPRPTRRHGGNDLLSVLGEVERR